MGFLSLLLICYLQIFEENNKRCARMLSNPILLANNSISQFVDSVKNYF